MRGERDLQFRLDAALTALFLAALFFLGAGTLVSEREGIRDSLTARRRVEQFLDDPAAAGPWDRFAARIRSLDDYLGDHLLLGEPLEHLNARFQLALGKRMIQSGDGLLLALPGGQFYRPETQLHSMEPAARSVLALRDSLPPGTPFLFIYIHPGPWDASALPPGCEALDRSGDMADELIGLLEAQGVRVLDSRDALAASGLAPSQCLMRTDNHWTTRAAMEVARCAAQDAARGAGIPLRPELLDVRAFESRTYPGLFLGTYGQRMGAANLPPDDITVYWPRYPTHIRRRTNYLGEQTDVEGEFRESVIRWRYLRAPEGQSWNTVAYFDYGLTEDWDDYQNASAPDCTILLFKDSFSAPMGGFLSLTASRVCAVDLRRAGGTPGEWAERLRPDIAIAAFSLPYLLNEQVEGQ